MMMVRCYLAPSAIEGLGVFSNENITKGDIVWRHDRMLDTTFPESKLDNVEPPVKEFLERYCFPDPCRPGYLILQCDEGRFLNHSMYPNLDFSDGVWGRALSNVAAGTELTFDYADFLTGEIRMQPPRHQLQMVAMAAE